MLALSQTTRSPAGAGAEARAQQLDLAAELLALLRLAERHGDFVGTERLVEVVVGAFAHRGQRAVLAAVGAHHDQQRLAAVGAVAPEEGHPVHLRHPHVAENDVEGLRRRPAERLLGVALAHGLVPRLLEQEREGLPQPGVVVNDQQSHRSHPREAGRL